MKAKRKYKRYTDELKRDAVRAVEEDGRSVASVARELGCNANSLHKWVKDHRENQAENGLDDDERAELKRLRAENARLKEEREILKKATAFFAKESK